MEILEKLNIKTNNNSLYETAFTHTSYSNEHEDCDNYERLEFLGDAVLELIISDYLYNEKHLEEGTMTKMRSSYVCEEACATYADDLEFGKYIRLGSGEIEANITIKADVFESFIAAMYLDKGFAFTSDIVLAIIKKYVNKGIDFLHDYKSELQELVQTGNKSVIYEVVDEKGPAHDKIFTSRVKVGNVIMGEGVGTSKKNAEQEAAKVALSKQVKVD
ncbi:MAG: ribonuclease III [Bacilli bacterium]|nr:ribonuclease III [Bacilli bacterium]